jgi:hypothetical protein
MPTIHYVEELTVEWSAAGTDYAKTFAELKVIAASHTEAVRGMDSLTLIVSRKIDAAPLWTRNQRIRLRNQTGQIVYHGWCGTPRTPLTAASERHEYTFGPATRFLESTYLAWKDFDDGTGNKSPVLSSNVILNYQWTDGEGNYGLPIDAYTQSFYILEFARLQGNSMGLAPFTFDLTGMDNYVIPSNTQTSIACKDALDKQCMWDPALDWHWDNRGTNPVLRMARYDMSATPPTVTGAPYVTVHTLPNDGTMIATMDPQPLDDRLASRVNIIWSYVENIAESGLTPAYSAIQTYLETAAVANGAPQTLSLDVELAQPGYDEELEYYVGAEAVHVGLAERVLNACRAVLWQFNFSTKTTGLHWEWRLGDLWNLTGGQDAMAAAYSTTVRIVRDLVRGTVRVDTGAPSFLSMTDLLALSQIVRTKRNTPTQEDTTGQSGGTMPERTKPIEPELDTTEFDQLDFDADPTFSVTNTGSTGAPKFKFAIGLPKPATWAADTPTTVAAGGTPTVDVIKTEDGYKIKIGVVTGATGAAPVLDEDVTVTITSPGAPASGSFTLTAEGKWKLSLTIPKGDTGAKGDPGENGINWLEKPADGPDGRMVVQRTGNAYTLVDE